MADKTTQVAELAANLSSEVRAMREENEALQGTVGELTASVSEWKERAARIEEEYARAAEADRISAEHAVAKVEDNNFLLAPTSGLMGNDLLSVHLSSNVFNAGGFGTSYVHKKNLEDAIASMPAITPENVSKHYATLEATAKARLAAMGCPDPDGFYDDAYRDQLIVDHDNAQKDLQEVITRRKKYGVDIENMRYSIETSEISSWIVTALASQLWLDSTLSSPAVSAIPNVVSLGATTRIPLEFGDVTWHLGSEDPTAPADSDVSPSHVDIVTSEQVATMRWSYRVDEDSMVPFARELRNHIVRQIGLNMENTFINGDKRTGGTNVNNFGTGTTVSLPGLRGFDGFVRAAQDGGNIIDGATFNNTLIVNLRKQLGKYGVMPSESFIIAGVNTFFKLLGLTELLTIDKVGPRATVLTGSVGSIHGMPVFVSENLGQAVGSSGVVAADNTLNVTDRMLLVNRTQYRKTMRRSVMIEMEKFTRSRYNSMTVSYRMGLQNQKDTSATNPENVAMLRNIT